MSRRNNRPLRISAALRACLWVAPSLLTIGCGAGPGPGDPNRSAADQAIEVRVHTLSTEQAARGADLVAALQARVPADWGGEHQIRVVGQTLVVRTTRSNQEAILRALDRQ